MRRIALPFAVLLGAACTSTGTVPTRRTPQPPPSPLPAAQSAAGEPRTQIRDADLAKAVRSKLHRDAMVELEAVRVHVRDGVVELTGPVPHLLAVERATRLARAVRGVRSVSNRLRLNSRQRSDAHIHSDVTKSLLFDPTADALELGIEVSSGVVTLTGKVQSWQEKRHAESVAKSVTGVKAVRNRVEVIYPEERFDHEIAADVRSRLSADPFVGDAIKVVSVRQGHVELAGKAGSAAEVYRAYGDAWVTGVAGVDTDAIEVERGTKAQLRRHGGLRPRTNDQIRRAVMSAYQYDPRLSASRVRVESSGGTVTLRGQVATLEARAVAEKLAHNTAGVTEVVNRLRLSRRRVADRTLAAQIDFGLGTNAITTDADIGVRVRRGVATLRGTVSSPLQRAEAERVAMSRAGIRSVDNQLKVRSADRSYVPDAGDPDELVWDRDGLATGGPVLSDRELEKRVDYELYWDPDINGNRVEVSTRAGTVTLEGRVETLAERIDAERNAYQAGAQRVENQLEVRAKGT